MNIFAYNDYELLYLIGRKSAVAYEILLQKYRFIIVNKINRRNFYGLSVDDIIQDCFLEMVNAISKYDLDREILFSTYMSVIIERKIQRIISKTSKEYFCVERIKRDVEFNLLEERHAYNNVLSTIIVRDSLELFESVLTSLEIQVAKEVMIGQKKIYDFATEYNIPIKKVYNTIQSIKQKYKKVQNN